MMPPLETLDPEVVDLCKALNAIPGVQTTESCSGHGRRKLRVWFRCAQIEALWAVARATDPQVGVSGMTCRLETASRRGDLGAPYFCLYSWQIGDTAYQRAQELAARIRELLANENFMRRCALETSP